MKSIFKLRAALLSLAILLGSMSFSYAQSCYSSSGCQDYSNFGYNSTSAATLEYDNYVSAFHSTVVRDLDGSLKIWGAYTKADGANHWLVPTTINAGNYPGLTGTPLKLAIGSTGALAAQFILLTSDNKLWAWGVPGTVLSSSLTAGASFQQLNIGLPTGVTAGGVKMLFATTNAVVLTTCGGEVYVLTSATPELRGDGGTSLTTWSQVQKQSGGALTGIVATRATRDGAIALDASGGLWVWGRSWDGVATTSSLRDRAIPLPAPSGATGPVKMIGATHSDLGQIITYYVLYQSGSLYAMGNNNYNQLGNWNTTNQPTWIQPTYNSATGTPMTNIKWISPVEHQYTLPAINVINNDKVVYNWGLESGNMLGRYNIPSSSRGPENPGQPGTFEAGYSNTNITSVETGGHTTMVLQECKNTFGYVGHRIHGSMGDNSAEDIYDNVVRFNTNAVQVCGGPVLNATLEASVNGPYCVGNTIQLLGDPAGGSYAINTANSTATATLSGTTLTFTGAGTLRVNYTVNDGGACGPVTVVKVFAVENCASKFIIPGTIWNDANGNGIIDGSEAGISNGLWVNLTSPSGNVIASVQVKADGTYAFEVGSSYVAASGNYSVVVTNQAREVGDPQAAADTPGNSYGYTGVNRGATGVDNTNRTGILSLGNLSTVAGGTTIDPANFGISNDPVILPVQFTSLVAWLSGNMLAVNWTTASEKNNQRFEIEASADGVHFVKIGEVNSKAPGGNSDRSIDYEFSTTDLSGKSLAAFGFGGAVVLLIAIAMGWVNKRKWLYLALVVVTLGVGVIGCQKKGADPVSLKKDSYIRIAQIDANGSKSYSKVVKVVFKN